MVTGQQAIVQIGIAAQCRLCLIISTSVAEKATIMAVTEKNNVVRPKTSFNGRDILKSCSCIVDVMMDKKTTTEVSEKQRDNASEVAKTEKGVVLRSRGRPALLEPPGTVQAHVKATVAISTATIVQACAVLISHSCPSCTSCLCFSVNNSWAVLLSLFRWLMKYTGTIFCTRCTKI